MEFKSGFDATPYMAASPASWGKPKYKKVTEPGDGTTQRQKLYTGNGLDIHPNKKDRYKLQGESDSDVKTNGNGSKRAAVAIKRRKGSDYIPVIEAQARIIPTESEGLLPMPKKSDFGAPEHDYGKEKYYEFCNREREWHASSKGLDFARREGEVKQHNAEVCEADLARRRRGIIATDTPEYAYKVFRLLTSDIVEHAKREGLTPAQFYQQFNAELYRIASDAAAQTSVERERFAAYIREHAPKVADAIAGKSETPKATPKPDSLEALQKKLSAATRRRDKAQREIDELDLQITALLSEKSVEEVRHDFYGDMEAIDREVEARPEPLRKSKKQQQREARREKRRAKRNGRKTSERMAA